MKTWEASIQINGTEYTSFDNGKFEIPDDIYDSLVELIKAGKSIYGTDCYKKACDYIESNYNIENSVPPFYDPEPNKEDYDDEEYYEEELQDYLDRKEGYYEDFFVESITLEDVGELDRLNSKFIGKTIADGWESDNYDEKWMDFEVQYGLYDFDNSCCSIVPILVDNLGKIVSIDEISTECITGISVKTTSMEECSTNYAEIEKYLENLCSAHGG